MPKKGRGKHGPWKDYDDIDRDGFLLREYDLWCKAATPKHAKRVPRMLGKILHRAAPGRFGGNADTIARRIRHLRDERKKRRPAAPVSTILSPFPHGN
jgi:hypothetical protein